MPESLLNMEAFFDKIGLPEEHRSKFREAKLSYVCAVFQNGNEISGLDGFTTEINSMDAAQVLGQVARGASTEMALIAKQIARDHGEGVAKAFMSIFFQSATTKRDNEISRMTMREVDEDKS